MSLFKKAKAKVKINLRAKAKDRSFHIKRGLKDNKALKNQIIAASSSLIGLPLVPILLQKAYNLGLEAWIRDEMQKYQIKKTDIELQTQENADWYAGGELYNACFAGGKMFNPSGLETPFERIANTKPIFKGDRKILEQIQAPYESLAGGNMFYQNVTKGTIVGRFMGT